MSGTAGSSAPGVATDAVMVKSEAMPAGSERVKGYDFNLGVDHHALLQSYRLSGFQATNFGLAVDQINAMVRDTHQTFTPRSLNATVTLHLAPDRQKRIDGPRGTGRR